MADDILSIMVEKKASDERATGYDPGKYSWFGQSIPDELVAECMLCNSTERLSRKNFLLKGKVPSVCMECRREALKVYDFVKWDWYVKLHLWEYELFRDQFDDIYCAITKDDGIREIHPLRSEVIRGRMALLLKNRSAIDNAMIYLEGLARAGGKKIPLDIRVAEREGNVWVDLCDEKWRAIKINSEGWQVVEKPPIIFKRYKHMLPLEIQPGGKQDFDDFLNMMHFKNIEDRDLYSGFLAQTFLAEHDRPILMSVGPQGAAKSSMCEATRLIIDPSSLPKFNMNTDENEIPQKVLQHYIPSFDNCGHISQEISDLLCTASSGMGFSKRKLFTDLDTVVYTARRSLIVNGISPPTMAPDLLDRTVMISLDRVSDEDRLEDDVVRMRYAALFPKVRWYLLDVAVAALKNPTQRMGGLPRLAKFARLGDACLVAMGKEPGYFIRTLLEANAEIAEQAVHADPLAEALIQFLKAQPNESWEGSVSDLYHELEVVAGSQTKAPGWPKTHNWMSESILGKLKPGMLKLGWSVGRNKKNGKRTIYLNKVVEDLKSCVN